MLPLPDAGRDLAVSALVLNFLPDRHEALAEMRRVVRANGTIARTARAWAVKTAAA